ncbi:hypothetical protein GCM10012280_06030 [Wenjunlia tyrosinilytica]|uniref:Lipoprotein n=1 Tax=Wenjunlia tyrosinilytica TaxID=1544741 RepID=A0A917ZEI2_9ACTN|nr:hypothetical protein GCM10012280_06030 [Wenjunlia tyrosinilytica]
MKLLAVAAAAAVLSVCGGCNSSNNPGKSGNSDTAKGSRPASSASPTAPRTLSPVDLCTEAVRYWTGEILDAGSDKGFDYQEMGLSDSQYETVRDLVAEARRTGQRPTEGDTAKRCRAIARASSSGAPSEGGWPG